MESGELKTERFSIMPANLLTREEAMVRLRVKPAHFSKIVNGKVKGLPKLKCVRFGRRLFFLEATLEKFVLDVEAASCSADR